MFEVVGYTATMGNSCNGVKRCADEVTVSDDSDGVVIFLDKLYKGMVKNV